MSDFKGKGSRQRAFDVDKFNNNFDAIFGKKEDKKKAESEKKDDTKSNQR